MILANCNQSTFPVSMSEEDNMAYVRPDMFNNAPVWSIFDAEGTKIGHANSREMAMAVVLQNDLVAYSVN